MRSGLGHITDAEKAVASYKYIKLKIDCKVDSRYITKKKRVLFLRQSPLIATALDTNAII